MESNNKEPRDPMIQVRELTVGYNGLPVLERISFEVRRGDVFAILGESGCGKSTLLKHMMGLYPPLAGQIVIDAHDLTAAVGAERRRLMSHFGVMYQSGALFGTFSLLENVRLPLEELTRLPLEAMDRIAEHKLQLVGLGSAISRLPSEISGGMIKRAAIARAMVMDPAVLFLDEPSAGLDPVTASELDDLVLRLARDLGMTFVMVTHELASIFKVADRVIMLDKTTQGIVAEGQPQALRESSTHPGVRRFFNRESNRRSHHDPWTPARIG